MRQVGTARIWPLMAALWLVVVGARGATPADTLAHAKGRRVVASSLEITAINAALVAHNRLLRSDDAFSHITFSDIRRNLTHRHWWWDQDYFHTNTIEHPLHGALFYTTARANGPIVHRVERMGDIGREAVRLASVAIALEMLRDRIAA